MTTKWQRIRVELPAGVKTGQRDAVAAEIIEFIKDRTQSGRDKKGRTFVKYSEAYRKRKGSSFVDLTLFNRMLDKGLELLSQTPRSLLIGFQNGTKENAKADGNIRGTYGQPSPIPGKARDFLGIGQRRVRDIVRSVRG